MRMKVYLATSGEYSDYGVCHVFAREEDARAYQLADDVEEFELREGPVEVWTWHELWWSRELPDGPVGGFVPSNPYVMTEQRDADGKPGHVQHRWVGGATGGPRLVVEGWDRERVMKVYSEQRAQYLARQAGIAT